MLQHVEVVQRASDVLGANARKLAEAPDGDLPVTQVVQAL